MITIVAMTWKELLRKKVMTLTLLLTVLFLLAFWFVAKAIGGNLVNYYGDKNSVEYLLSSFMTGATILGLGFFFASFVIAFQSIFTSSSVIAGEAEQGIMQALLPRSISRSSWYVGRWLGFVSMGIIYAFFLFVLLLWIAKAHASIPMDILVLLKSFLLFAFSVPLLVTVSMLGSCFFSAIGNGVFMTMLFGAGWLGGMIGKVMGERMITDPTLAPLQKITGILSLLMPMDLIQQRMLGELFSLQDLMNMAQINQNLGPFGIQQMPSNAFLLYALVYMLVALVAGIVIFKRKDL
jgi:ABC-type transport system involved in multi-copper enzyme maturation permease subunit